MDTAAALLILTLLIGAAMLTFVVRVTAVVRDWSAPIARS